jgi:hypothetical protein
LEYAFFHQFLTENDSISSDIKEGKYLVNTPPKRVRSGKNKKDTPLSDPCCLQSFVDTKVDSYIWSHTLLQRTKAASDKEVPAP